MDGIVTAYDVIVVIVERQWGQRTCGAGRGRGRPTMMLCGIHTSLSFLVLRSYKGWDLPPFQLTKHLPQPHPSLINIQ